MKLKTVLYDFSAISVNNSQEQKTFKEDIKISNIIYLFYKDNECLYIGETSTTLKDRCYTHTPKHSEKDWFKEANKIHIIELDNIIDNIARQTIESTLILAYRPKNNRKS